MEKIFHKRVRIIDGSIIDPDYYKIFPKMKKYIGKITTIEKIEEEDGDMIFKLKGIGEWISRSEFEIIK